MPNPVAFQFLVWNQNGTVIPKKDYEKLLKAVEEVAKESHLLYSVVQE